MSSRILILFLIVFPMYWFSCSSSKSNSGTTKEVSKIFNRLSPEESGITFANHLKEDTIVNYFTYPYIYMGGGVAVGDVNNDGLQDLYFTANMAENKLYLNKGNLKFEDITIQAKVGGDNRWVTGVTMVDINADGWLDIYVSVSGKFTTTKNLLYLNDGHSENGIPTFTESAEALGLADEGHTTQATFFDYDKDGDLDAYMANYPYTSFKTPNYTYRIFLDEKKAENSDRLYQNQGDGTFKDVTAESGIQNFGLSLSATVGDFNQDGWEDIYISNDFASPDFFYFNNGDGTFSEQSKESMPHTAFFGMGVDVADFNNDGLLDLMQLDMTPEDNRRNKANMASMDISGFWDIVNLGMHYQYMQNTLQLNNGIAVDGLPHFSDVGRLAGVSSTDWSWAVLFADLDNDGWKDIFITNGTRKDINNKDYFNKIEKATYQEKQKFNQLDLSKNIPFEEVDNYAFRNNGDLTFEPVIEKWGLSHKGFSNGATYADLDNDGDLDLVTNNIDDYAFVFQNRTSDMGRSHYLRVQFNGPDANPLGIGTQVSLKNEGNLQYQHLAMTRGFQSSVEPYLHFGLGQETEVDELLVTWTDGKQQILKNITADQILTIDYKDAAVPDQDQQEEIIKEGLFADFTEAVGIDYMHKENEFDDYQHEILLPHTYSKNGPGLAVGDVNGDQLDDFYIGGASSYNAALYTQNQDGTFNLFEGDQPWQKDKMSEDLGALFFDADKDGDQDLYVVSGGNEYKNGKGVLQDRLYINDGTGNFEKSKGALPEMRTSGSRVKAGDFDGDGDLDLFVGGRIVPRSYPLPARSYILKNESTSQGVKFVDVTEDLAPELTELGLVTDAVWADYDGDGALDLVVVGEWLPLTFFKNTGKAFKNKTEDYGLEKSTGWWYSIAAEDFDNDGDMDFVAGNLGLNYKYQANEEESFDVYAYDYDKNGNLDIVLGYYNEGVQYPVRGRQCSSEQIPTIKYKFEDYNSFAAASLSDIYTAQDLEASLHYQVWNFASSYIENKGNGSFELQNLPNEVQLSSINGIVVEDVNDDGHQDLILAGNLYGAEVETPRNDASYGHYLEGNGKGNFKVIPFTQSGLFVKGDTKNLDKIMTAQGTLLLFANNNDRLKAVKINNAQKVIQ